MGNIKESIIPYFKKEMKLAKLSFDLYGALSPSEEKKKEADSNPDSSSDRVLTQVELESSAPAVGITYLVI